jgi:hypothetical protein
MSEKPKLKLTLPDWGKRVWLCTGCGGMGKGHSPQAAYEAWERYIRFYGKSP